MIIDYIENLEFNPEDKDYLFDAEMTLARISQGLFWLNKHVLSEERLVRKKAQIENVQVAVAGGLLDGISTDWLSCAFQWYSISIYNYVRLVGWLATKDINFVNSYLNRVIPVVKTYRHKVSAHFSITAPKPEDNEADRIASIMTNVVFVNDALRAGAMSEILTDENGNEIEISHHTSWSLTRLHNKLIKRYWPEGPFNTYNSIKISANTTRKIKIDYRD